MARLKGLEPLTLCSGGTRSNPTELQARGGCGAEATGISYHALELRCAARSSRWLRRKHLDNTESSRNLDSNENYDRASSRIFLASFSICSVLSMSATESSSEASLLSA